jgi:hypothetical protein
MGRLIINIFLLLFCIGTRAQDTSFIKPVKIISGNFRDFYLDNVGNIYVISNSTRLKKLNPEGDSIAVYNDVKRFGKISAVDATNPFNILVYYPESSAIAVLDRLLSVRTVIDLKKNNIQQAKAICLSYDNNIWLYDEADGKIKKIDDKGKLLFESVDLRNALGVAPSFQNIIDENRSLYLYDPNLGWYVFDYYGAFSKKYSFISWKDVQVINGSMIGRTDRSYMIAKKGDLDFKTMKQTFPFSGAIKTWYSNKHWYVLFPGKLEIYDAS